MRALLLQGNELRLGEMERPVPGPGQVLGRVRACGICGSDLHFALYREQNEAMMRGGRPAVGPSRPIVMGHEFVAEIVAAGPDGTPFPIGTRVTGAPWVPDPRGERGWQTIGYSTRYPGGYGEYVVMTASLLNAVPDHLSDEVAATVEPCAVGLHAVREARLRSEERVLVMGAGPIGLMTLLWLKHVGVRQVAISDYAAARRALAGQIGADLVLDPAGADVGSAVAAAFGGPPDVVFDCVGVAGTLQAAFDLVPRRGRVAVVGVCMTEDVIRPMTGITKHLTVQFMSAYTAEEVGECLRALAEGRIDTAPIVTRTIAQDELPEAFKALGDPKDCKVVVLYP
jgi:2-desacetyl-2-hydroxyethyl bacteriochlorophyllide A dehydrogenase